MGNLIRCNIDRFIESVDVGATSLTDTSMDWPSFTITDPLYWYQADGYILHTTNTADSYLGLAQGADIDADTVGAFYMAVKPRNLRSSSGVVKASIGFVVGDTTMANMNWRIHFDTLGYYIYESGVLVKGPVAYTTNEDTFIIWVSSGDVYYLFYDASSGTASMTISAVSMAGQTVIPRAYIRGAPYLSYALEVLGGWVGVPDVLPPVSLSYGMPGTTPNDRVAETGRLSFALNNSETNSQGTLGLYSPGGASCVDWFELGTIIRVRLSSDTVTHYRKWYGKIDSIQPIPGVGGVRRTNVTCVDWMDEASRAVVKGLPVTTDGTADTLFNALTSAMENPPLATQVGAGMENYPYAFDTSRDEGLPVSGELQKITQSEMGYVYPKGDAVNTGLIVFEDRRMRPLKTTADATFDGLNDLDPKLERDDVITRVIVKAHPRTVDSAAVVLFTLGTPIELARNSSTTFNAPYKDPDQQARRCGAVNCITPASTTDFAFSATSSGGGTYTSQLSVTSSYGGNSANVTVSNAGPYDGWVTFLQLRGYGVYDYGEIAFNASSTSLLSRIGDNALTFDMPYQADVNVANECATYLLQQNSVEKLRVDNATIIASTLALANQVIQREISDRITVADTVTGINDDYFINAVSMTFDPDGIARCSWTLVPADKTLYWELDSTTQSQLDSTTILAFGLWNEYWKLGTDTLGTDTVLAI